MLLWLDMETTGLDYEVDIPIEVGIILMKENGLKEVARKSWLCAVRDFDFHPYEQFVHRMHTDNGLLAELEQATVFRSYSDVDDTICAWLDANTPPEEILYPAGSSVHFDVRFAERRLPQLYSKFYHRHLDVSSIKMLSMLVGAEYDKGPADPHRALGDLDNDILWLKNFLALSFMPPLL